jgi:DNA-binding NtrC family response regulator
MAYKPTVLIIDDLALVRLQFKALLSKEFTLLEADTQKRALSILEKQTVQLIVLDLVMPDVSGFTLLQTLRTRYPNTPIVMATVNDDPQAVLKSLKLGAKDYIFKDELATNPEILANTLWETLQAQEEKQLAASVIEMQKNNTVFIPEDATYHKHYEMALHAVRGDFALIILGETGVGKGTLVSYIHQTLMPKKPLVTVNLGAKKVLLPDLAKPRKEN